MSYLSERFIEICDQCPDPIACDTTIDEIIMNESFYMTSKRYNTRNRSRIDVRETRVRNDSSEKGENDEGGVQETTPTSKEEEDEEFLNDVDVLDLESELKLDLTTSLRKNLVSNRREMQIETEQIKDTLVETTEKPKRRKGEAKVPSRQLERRTDTDLDVNDEEPLTYVLTSWVLQFSSKSSVFVEGELVNSSNDSNQEKERKNSSSIVQRINSSTLCSKSGNMYRLKGPMNSKMASECGVSEIIISKFRNGFPKKWVELITEHSLNCVSKRQDVSRRTRMRDNDISSFKCIEDEYKKGTKRSQTLSKVTKPDDNDCTDEKSRSFKSYSKLNTKSKNKSQ